MPGCPSLDESYPPSLIWQTRTDPLPDSGVNEIHPAGTGSPLNVTRPESWAIGGWEEQPTARARTAAPPSSRRIRPRIGRLLEGDGLPVGGHDLPAGRGGRPHQG